MRGCAANPASNAVVGRALLTGAGCCRPGAVTQLWAARSSKVPPSWSVALSRSIRHLGDSRAVNGRPPVPSGGHWAQVGRLSKEVLF